MCTKHTDARNTRIRSGPTFGGDVKNRKTGLADTGNMHYQIVTEEKSKEAGGVPIVYLHPPMILQDRLTRAYVLPFLAFMACLAAVSVIQSLAGDAPGLFLRHPEYIVYPVQTVLCAGLLIFYWRCYSWNRLRGLGWGVLAGGIALLLWLAPQLFFGSAPRLEGFDPTRINSEGGYFFTVGMRLLRLVIIVPLLEEIFWRGFLLRYLTREDWQGLAFGECSRKAFILTAVCFALVHQWADMPAAFLTGLIYNQVAVYTRSLAACVAAHAITNLGLGWYIMATRQWGFW